MNFRKNLELFARDNPIEAERLETHSVPSEIKFCRTYEGELNLIDDRPTEAMYWHQQEGALWEAESWAKKLSLEDKDVIFIYGLGLGYYYLPLKKWLEKPGRYLVFLEDTLPVISCFLGTELAAEMLENPQVMVKVLPSIAPNEEGWEKLRQWAAPLFAAFAFSKAAIFALNAYFVNRFEFYHAFSAQWLSGLCDAERQLVEFYPNTPLIFHNFYANLYHLPEAVLGYRLEGIMQGFPAVLCGAGPSLTKQLPLLKTLSEKALIFASGTAMNAVTQKSIIPHAGGGVDPTETQASRQLTSFGFEVPIFYQNRFFSPALKQWHGPLIYMTGSGGYRVSEWFEKELGITEAPSLIMGVSTSNFLLEIAGFLGCRQIVLIGMDLAYTEGARYAKGVFEHPEESPPSKAVISVLGFGGEEVETNNQWFYEAVCMAAFKERNPSIACVNATEGGMVIPSVPNVNFSEVVSTQFPIEWDMEGWLHGAIQNLEKEKISLEKVRFAVSKWKNSLERCFQFLDHLKSHLQELAKEKRSTATNLSSDGFYRGQAALWQQELYQEPAYVFLLETLNIVFETVNSLRIRKLQWLEKKESRAEEIAIEIDRCEFLQDYVKDHLKSLCEAETSFDAWKSALSEKVVQNEPLAFQNPPLEALIGKIHEQREGQTLYFYPNGQVKAEAFYRQGRLHGPWSFFSPEGHLLFRRWYVDGKKEGRSCAYYSNGSLYCVQEYQGGDAQGVHVYYYPDGVVKSVISYEKGLLHGPVRLYYPNGRLKKTQTFDRGKLHGSEQD